MSFYARAAVLRELVFVGHAGTGARNAELTLRTAQFGAKRHSGHACPH